MNKIKFASIAIIACLPLSQAAFANDESVTAQVPEQQLVQELTKAELQAATEGYVLSQTIRTQSRRSALFAHILDTISKNATLAKAEQALVNSKS